MPSPGKRDFDEFTHDYTSAFPISPIQWGPDGWPIGGWASIPRKEDEYKARIKRAYKVATRDSDVDPTRYIPGAYPDDILLPEQLVVPPVIVWGAIRVCQGVDMAQNTYTTARHFIYKGQKAAKATQQVVIGAIEVIGSVKRRAIQVLCGRSHQEIIRAASRASSSHSSSPNRRQRSPRPSSPPLSAPLSSSVQQQQIRHIIEPSTHQVFETTSVPSFIPSKKPLEDPQALAKAKKPKKGEKSPRAGKKERSRKQSVLRVTETAGNKVIGNRVTKPQKPGQWYKPIGNSVVPCSPPLRKAKKFVDRLELVRKIGQHSSFAPPTAPVAPSAASVPAVVPPPVVFPPLVTFSSPVAPSFPVIDLTDDALVEELEDSSEQAVEYASRPVVAEATPIKHVEESQASLVDLTVDQQTASSPFGTYNGLPDISMQDASLLEESVAPPLRHVHWHESPRTGGPVSSVKIMTPQQSGPFDLIADRVATSPASEIEAGPSGVGPAIVENATVNEPESVSPVPDTQMGTSVEPPAVVVENMATIELGSVVDAPLGEPTPLQSVQESLDLLTVSQSTDEDRRAKKAATKAAKEAERKRREEEAARAKQAAEEAEEKRRLRRFPAKPIIEPLSAEWDAKVAKALSQENAHELAWRSTGTVLTRRDFGTAVPQNRSDGVGYLNDEIINGYIEKSIEYGNGTAGKKDLPRGATPKVAYLESFFYDNLRNKGPASVQKWATRRKFGGKDLLSVERLFIPINESLHWTLAVVSPKLRTLEYFDSLGGSGARYINNIKLWLKQELGNLYVESEWKVLKSRSPRQNNGTDCGVFAITTAKLIVLGVDPLAFTHNDTILQRRRILAELMNGGFFGDFEPNVVFEDD